MNYTVAFQLLTGVLYSNLNKIQMEIAKLSKKEMSEVIKICLKFYKLLNGDDDNSTSNMTNTTIRYLVALVSNIIGKLLYKIDEFNYTFHILWLICEISTENSYFSSLIQKMILFLVKFPIPSWNALIFFLTPQTTRIIIVVCVNTILHRLICVC